MSHASIDVQAPAPPRAPVGGVNGRAGRQPRGLRGHMGRRPGLEEGLAIVCLLAVVGVDLALIRVGLDAMDEGYFIEQASRVLRGDLPYRDFDSLYTPGLLYLHAALLSLVGEPHVIVLRAVGLVARVVLAGGLYLLCRPLARPIFAILPGLYVLLGLDSIPTTWEPHPGWPSAALIVLAAWWFSRLPRLSCYQRPRWLLAIGAVSGLAFAFKQNAGVFLIMALVAFVAWQGLGIRRTAVTPVLRVTQLLLLVAVVLAAAWLIRPSQSGVVALYFLVPLVAAGVAATARVPVAPDGRRLGSWLRAMVWVGLGITLVTVPWVVALLVALGGRVDLLRGFVGAVDQSLLWRPLIGPKGGAWASLLGFAVATLLALRLRHHIVLLGAAVAAGAVFAVSGVLLTAEPGESLRLAALLAAGRTATGLAVLLPVLCILAGAWVSLRSPATVETWQLRWLTVAGALTFLTQYPRIDDVHLAWSACLPLATGAVVLGRLYDTLAERWKLGWPGRAVLVGALVAVPLATILPGLAQRSEGFFDIARAGHLAPRLKPTTTESSLPAVAGLIVTQDQSDTLLAVVRLVQAHTAPGEPIFVYPSSPLVYVSAERPNPTRFAHLYPGAASSEQLDDIIETLEHTPVRVVVVSGADLSFWGPAGRNQPLETYLAQNYHEVARFDGYRVLLRN